MTAKARWFVGIVMVVALVAVSMGFAAAQGEQTSPSAGRMMGGAGFTTGGMMGAGSTIDGMVGTGAGAMMAGTDVDAMHEQMMVAMAGKIPAEVLTKCDALHDRMMTATSGAGTTSAAHEEHHPGAGGTPLRAHRDADGATSRRAVYASRGNDPRETRRTT